MAAVYIDASKCTGCAKCTKECACACLKVENGKAVFADRGCMKCGHCFAVCPTGAVELFGEKAVDEKFQPELVEDAVRMRRSVRQFSGPLEEQYIRDLIGKTKHCASACNFRPIKFLVISRPKLSEIAMKAAAVLDKVRPGMLKMQEKVDLVFRGAPHMIVTYVDQVSAGYLPDEDSAIMLATLELLAQKDGVGTFWCGFFKGACQDPEVLKSIGLEGKKVFSCMGIGKSAAHYMRTAAREDVDIKFI